MKTGYVRFEGRDGGTRFGAFWSRPDKIQHYDRPLGSRQNPADHREDEGEIRVGYEVARYIFAGQFQGVEPVEVQPLGDMRLNGEPFAEGWPGERLAVGLVPVPQPSRHWCGGEVQATLYLAAEISGLPAVRVAYVSRDDSGKLRIAIPA